MSDMRPSFHVWTIDIRMQHRCIPVGARLPAAERAKAFRGFACDFRHFRRDVISD